MLILASNSPRRASLLKTIIPNFKIIPANIDERLLDNYFDAFFLAKEESRLKAYKVFSVHPNDEVLACDTIVVLDNQILEKPMDENEAINMLSKESSRKQIVISGYTYISSKKEISKNVITAVYFKNLSKTAINEYVLRFKPLDKAGAYGIQDDFPLI